MMGECNLDHSLEDVLKKLEDQKAYLPADLAEAMQAFLQQQSVDQATLNHAFHLLKKYDLATKEEQDERNESIKKMLKL